MSEKHRKEGSIWTRWDLHLHTPGTKLSSGFGEPTDAVWSAYLEALEQSDVQVFGITDYFSYDNYFLLVEKYHAAYPDGTKVFFPNVEFRLTETISKTGKNVHTHVIFDNDLSKCPKEKLEVLFSVLKTHKTSRTGATVRCSELTEQDYVSATVSIVTLAEALRETFGDDQPYIIVTAANNDGLKSVDTKSPRSRSISDELDKASHAFFGSAKNVEWFLSKERYEGGAVSKPKPVFSGSDVHSPDDLKRLSGDEPNFEPTWIKADPTFSGLRQTLFEPAGRIYIGERPPVLVRQDREGTRFIAELRVNQKQGYDERNGKWFKNVVIPFNPELTAIVGNKGSGKSAIADILGLLGESRQDTHFSFLTDDPRNRKFRRPGYAENFEATVQWQSGGAPTKKVLSDSVDRSKPEYVKYLPQNYFESLTNEIEVKALRKEIEEVVFSHVDEADRMGTSNFDELQDLKTAQSKSDISAFKTRLRELNIEIVSLEKQADPAFKKALEQQLNAKNEERRVLNASRPQPVAEPPSESEEQQKVASQIAETSALLSDLSERGKISVERLSNLKETLHKLTSLKESVLSLGDRVRVEKEALKVKCDELGLNVEEIVTHQTDLSTVNEKIGTVSAEIASLEIATVTEFSDDIDLKKIASVPDLRGAYTFVASKIQTLRETLSAPQRRYQSFLQANKEIDEKERDILGDEEDPKPGTIRALEKRIAHIDTALPAQLTQKREERKKIVKSVFESKKKVRQFYEALKASVEERLAIVSSSEFAVTIDASFVPSHSLEEDFLGHINQKVRGEFRGSEDGSAKFQSMAADVAWDDFDSVFAFAENLIQEIRSAPVEPQVKDIKELYDYLFSFEYFDARYELRLGNKNLNQLSPGEKGLLLLVFYLHLDKEKTPLIIDQPEDNLDNESIFLVLASCIREAKKARQVILVTHNPNLAIGADAEQILYVTLKKHANYEFSYETGAIENPRTNEVIVRILEGSRPAFVQRRLAYQIK
ncbi:SMC domain protein [Parvibaculum lavamentivorans DS-1]|uniref:SMC domain protein n=1 Tax=Parvibaculum lavamentivorans (strain DS-1 / DSM 13023 / NCIMB 13966) TaxID=402881 RepID=A7HRY7_PARL1|nr:AAA family ATPase [Parvibaculum lavamentivorans]ABS62670.1 SMC domain protein [Parvibaculum lavamentivorans DS-1]